MATIIGPPWSGSTDPMAQKFPPSACRRLPPPQPHGDEGAAAYHLFKIDGAAKQWRCEMIARQRGADGIIREVERKILV